MANRKKAPSAFDFGFAAVCFACVLQVFGQAAPAPEAKEAVSYFALSIPMLLITTILSIALANDPEVNFGEYQELVEKGLGLATLFSVGVGIMGIYLIFRSVSHEAADYFMGAIFLPTAIGLLIYKIARSHPKKSADPDEKKRCP